MNRQIRKATINDLEAITKVEAECFPPKEAATAQDFKERLTIYSNYFWLLYEGEKLIGFVNGMVTDDANLTDEMYKNAKMHRENGKWQMIFGVNTIPSYRRQGCAERLINQVIIDAKKQAEKDLY
jgi:ribosomal protein S18 acetylase RimI-like enzyme